MSNLKLPAVQSFADAWNWLRDKRTIGKGDRFAYCTTLRITDGGNSATVRHHQTDIIVYRHDGSIVLADDGLGSERSGSVQTPTRCYPVAPGSE